MGGSVGGGEALDFNSGHGLGSWDQVPGWAPCSAGLLQDSFFPSALSPLESTCSLALSQINKEACDISLLTCASFVSPTGV